MAKREVTGNILYYIDLLTPPILRNSFIFSKIFPGQGFKSDIITQDEELIKQHYRTSNYLNRATKRPTDLTEKSLSIIKDYIVDKDYKNICDLGGGNLYLKNELNKSLGLNIDVLDFNYSDKEYGLREHNLEKKITFIPDNKYDLSISTHTIEHLLNSKQFISEMRRISKSSILLVFPKQFPYKHTPDTHINFFPYKFEVEKLFGKINYRTNNLVDLKFDWIYTEYQIDESRKQI